MPWLKRTYGREQCHAAIHMICMLFTQAVGSQTSCPVFFCFFYESAGADFHHHMLVQKHMHTHTHTHGYTHAHARTQRLQKNTTFNWIVSIYVKWKMSTLTRSSLFPPWKRCRRTVKFHVCVAALTRVNREL